MDALAWAEFDALRAWLLAQLDDDEQNAERVHEFGCAQLDWFDPQVCDCDCPVEILEDVAAKRALIEAVKDDPFDAMGAEWAYEQLVLRHLAAGYANRDGYRREWRVGG